MASSPGDPATPSARLASSPSPRALWLATTAVFLGVWAGLALFYARHPVLYDADAYYHLAIARATAHLGRPLADLPWLRFSVLRPGFGDKEVLFHLLLAPFAALADPLAGGRLALALCNALIAAALAHLGVRALGWWGLVLPFWLFFATTESTWRLVRLRPELLSLFLLLLAAWAIARRRYRSVGALAALYTLCYTAFHVYLGLCGLLFLAFGWLRRRWEWGLLLYPLLGAGLALVAHPNFPKNLEVWVVQNVQFFARRAALDVGTEFQPNATDVVLLAQLGWLLGLLALWRSGVPEPAGDSEAAAGVEKETAERAAIVFAVAALVFGVLYLLMSRFAFYFFPFATLWALFELRRRGRRLGRWTALPGRGRVPLALAFGLSLLVSLPVAKRALALFAQRTDPGPGAIRLVDRVEVGKALPAGARVAAPWRSTPIYMLWAPQARYLNTLDPVFMATPFPEVYAAQRAVFEGAEPDVPLATALDLDSDYLAIPTTGETDRLVARLAADPRVATLHRGFNGVYRLLPAANRAFVLAWRLAPLRFSGPAVSPGDIPAPGSEDATSMGSWPSYPLHPSPRGRAFEGFVDARRLEAPGAPAGCIGLVHEESVASATRIEYELAPMGATSVSLDAALLASTTRDLDAVLGQGLELPVTLQPGAHRLFVVTCPARDATARTGFYLLERDRRAAG